LQQFARIINPRDRLKQALHHVALVVNWELDGHPRQCIKSLQRLGRLAAVLHIEINQAIAMNAVTSEDDKDGKVRNQDRQVEPVGVIDTSKGVLVKDLVEV